MFSRVVHCRQEDPSSALTSRRAAFSESVVESVRATIADVQDRGDAALLDAARKFDAPNLASLMATAAEIDKASCDLGDETALLLAAIRIEEFHRMQLEALTRAASHDGIGWRFDLSFDVAGQVGQRMLPVDRAGIYVPGGKAEYPSSVLMNALPASVAGVSSLIMASPARSDGTLPPSVLIAARRCGIEKVAKVGGAAAIAALALGTESVPRVDVIAGPGNAYVTEAKRQLWGQVGLDGFAGPSEVAIIADGSVPAAWVAADLLTQVEHSSDNVGFLIVTSEAVLAEVTVEAEKQLVGAPREADMRTALSRHGMAFVVRDLHEAADVANVIAPEHLTIAATEPERLLAEIRNAACVLLGPWSAQSSGDFVVGPSHTLPTSGAARFGSPVSVLTFLKVQSLIHLGQQDLRDLETTIVRMAQLEGFPAHGRGASIRFQSDVRPDSA